MPEPCECLDFTESVLEVVESIPVGRVMSYGSVAGVLGRGGPRQVGAVMAAIGGAVPWWRVVRADGTVVERLRAEARPHYLEESTPLRSSLTGPVRVDMARASWLPQADGTMSVGSDLMGL